jgi:hypothetical protein
MEGSDTFTMNDHYFTDSKAVFLGKLKEANLGILDKTPAVRVVWPSDKNAWLVVNWDRHLAIHVQDAAYSNSFSAANVLDYLKRAGISFKTLDEIHLAQTTPEDDELNMMAATLAYCKVVVGSGVPAVLFVYIFF